MENIKIKNLFKYNLLITSLEATKSFRRSLKNSKKIG